MTNTLNNPEFRRSFALEETRLRQQVVELVDEMFLAFKASGRPDEEYLVVQFYEHKLFASVNSPELDPVYVVGGLKLIKLYLKECIKAYRQEAAQRARLTDDR